MEIYDEEIIKAAREFVLEVLKMKSPTHLTAEVLELIKLIG